MKAISLWQPWASAIALGAKRIETRSWYTPYRGPLAIHAAKRCIRSEMREIAECSTWCSVLWPLGLRVQYQIGDPPGADPAKVLPFGAVVAVCRLTDCRKTESFARSELDARRTPPPECGSSDLHWWTERMLGDFTPGRFGWVLEEIKPITPIPYKGEQGLFEIPDSFFKENP